MARISVPFCDFSLKTLISPVTAGRARPKCFLSCGPSSKTTPHSQQEVQTFVAAANPEPPCCSTAVLTIYSDKAPRTRENVQCSWPHLPLGKTLQRQLHVRALRLDPPFNRTSSYTWCIISPCPMSNERVCTAPGRTLSAE